jgi:uncharacterized DUF497 family protein
MRIEDFDWTHAVSEKVQTRHRLTIEEVESAMLDRRARIRKAERDKFILLGRSATGSYITIIFAYRRRVARIITARRMDAKERRTYRKSGN